MKANELMIGDWVLWKNKPVQVVRVSGIKYEFGHYDVLLAYCNGYGDGIETHDISSISPIHLTVEILEKNGFIPSPHKWDLQSKDETYPYEIHLEDEGHFMYCEIKSYDAFMQIKICDVHEFQHALRLCGLNELADNFKI